jgi:hypothetical protein
VREWLDDYYHPQQWPSQHFFASSQTRKNGRLGLFQVAHTVKTGSGTREIESKSGAGCFVATSAFEGAEHPTVIRLRLYRDNVLIRSDKGKKFIDWYYKSGPKMAKVLDMVPLSKPLVRFFINILASLVTIKTINNKG